jgi:predicted O-methyltransferase YrrM
VGARRALALGTDPQPGQTVVMDHSALRPPAALGAILERTASLGFGMACETRTGAFLRAMAAMKPAGRLVELGTGTGAGTAWILDGMSADAELISIDAEPEPQSVAKDLLGDDHRLELLTMSAGDWLDAAQPGSFDLVFADAWIGKFDMLERSLGLLRPGGMWIGDDLLPQSDWPQSHRSRVTMLLDTLASLPDHRVVNLAWASGIVLVVRRGDEPRSVAREEVRERAIPGCSRISLRVET